MVINGHDFYNEMYKKDPTRWDVPNGSHPFDKHIKDWLEVFYGRMNGTINVVDLGCGNGRTLKFISNPKFHLFGVDYSEEAIKLAKVNCPTATLEVCEMTRTNFSQSYFDVVLSVGSYEHQEKLDFSEPRRLIRTDGYFICVLPDTLESNGLKIAVDEQHHDWELTKEDWIKKVEPFGFKFQNYLNPWTFIFKPC